MILANPRARSGITLTEILISILIMGVGLLSLATLFPLGLQRMRAASEASRSALLFETAREEIQSRNLLHSSRFAATPYYQSTAINGAAPVAAPYFYYDPFVQDTPLPGYDATGNFSSVTQDTSDSFGYYTDGGVWRGYGLDGKSTYPQQNYDGQTRQSRPLVRYGRGLPVAYDPLWRSFSQITPNNNTGNDGRFGFGIGVVRTDPDGGTPSAYGLQRLSNFVIGGGVVTDTQVASIFTSPDDIVFQTEGDSNQNTIESGGFGSPVVPDMSQPLRDANSNVVLDNNGNPIRTVLADWSYTWIWTGSRADSVSGEDYTGDIVVFHNRPLGFDPVTGAAGERVVEAVWAYSGSVSPTGPNVGFSSGDNRVVLLRWPNTQPDPDVRVGHWMADVTYERSDAFDHSRFRTPQIVGQQNFPPGQRCHWYQVYKRNPAEIDPWDASYRRMIVVVDRPVDSKSILNLAGLPGHVNVALICPYVVYARNKTFTMR